MWANNTLEFGEIRQCGSIHPDSVVSGWHRCCLCCERTLVELCERETRKDGGQRLMPNIFVDFMHKIETANSFPNIANTVG